MALLLVALLFGCRPATEPVAQALPTAGPLNGTFVIRVGASLDPLSVTHRSVQVMDSAGRPLAVELRPCAAGLSIELVVDAELLERPPGRMHVRLAGGASGHPLLRRDGRPRPRSEVVTIDLQPRLAERSGGGLRLTNLPDDEAPFRLDEAGALRLEFDGVLDPASVEPGALPLFPLAHGVRLAPIHPTVEWQVVGGRSQLRLGLGSWTGELLLVTRRLGLRALDGSAPEPRVEREVVGG